MSNHTPEPWSKNAISPTVYDGNGIAILRCEGRTLIAENEANARRIAACVNACAGVSTEKLEGEASNLREWHEQMRLDAIDIAARNLDLKAQRDELLAALKSLDCALEKAWKERTLSATALDGEQVRSYKSVILKCEVQNG